MILGKISSKYVKVNRTHDEHDQRIPPMLTRSDIHAFEDNDRKQGVCYCHREKSQIRENSRSFVVLTQQGEVSLQEVAEDYGARKEAQVFLFFLVLCRFWPRIGRNRTFEGAWRSPSMKDLTEPSKRDSIPCVGLYFPLFAKANEFTTCNESGIEL